MLQKVNDEQGFIPILIAIIVLIILLIIFLPHHKKADPTPTKNANANSSSTPKKPASSNLSQRTQAAYLKQIGYESISELNQDKNNVVGSPENEIVSFTDDGSGNVDVRVQDTLTKQQAKLIGNNVMISAAAGNDNLKDLKTVTVQDSVGKDILFVTRSGAGLKD